MPQAKETAKVTCRKDYRPYPFTVEQCHLSFDIFEEHVLVSSRLELRRNPARTGSGNCILNGVGLQIRHLAIDGRNLQKDTDYRCENGKLELLNSAEKESFTFTAEVQIDPYNNKSLEGLYRSGQMLCTQNEATGFRHITFYPDRPDVMSLFTTEISADKKLYPRLLSNGNLLETKDLGNGRHYARWHDPFRKPVYLYALVAGDLDLLADSFTTCGGRTVTLEIYTDKGKTEKARFAMQSLKQAMAWDEQHFGREYDLNLFMIVAVDSFNFGAMENKGLNIFNSSLVSASEDTATDATYERIASVIAHEYFHNWTGNRITCRDWFQLTLKEGLTVYRDELFSEDHFGREVCRIEQVTNLRDNQYPEDAGPNRHPIRPESFIDINNFYTQTVYEKGAAVIRMMASYLGREKFRKGMDLYFERFDGQAVTCDDFVDAIQEGGAKDLSLLRRWYEQAGTPQLYVEAKWKPSSDGGELLLRLRQENPACNPQQEAKEPCENPAAPLAFPFPLAIYDPQEGRKLYEETVFISEEETELRYRLNSSGKPVPSLLLDHISPLEVHYDYSEDELLLLLSADQDPFNRYEAMQRYHQKQLLPGTTDLAKQGLAPEFISRLHSWLKAHCGKTAEQDYLRPRYLAQLLRVPSVQMLSAAQQPPNFPGLHQLREAYCTQLAHSLESEMQDAYQALSQKQYRRDEPAVGQRALRNTLLHYLCRLSSSDAYCDLACRQYQNSDNMTDSYAALQALACWPGQSEQSRARSQEMLLHFAERWKDDFLVLCRWFALQAGVPRPETLERVQVLEQHPLFQNDNPNMLRSLYSVLGHNLPVFHRKDGGSYSFLARRILRIDSFNSMMAADLAKCFVAYPRLDQASRGAMGAALEQIVHQRGSSARLCEIVERTLGS